MEYLYDKESKVELLEILSETKWLGSDDYN